MSEPQAGRTPGDSASDWIANVTRSHEGHQESVTKVPCWDNRPPRRMGVSEEKALPREAEAASGSQDPSSLLWGSEETPQILSPDPLLRGSSHQLK